MSLYMADINLPDNFSQDFLELIPYQRSHIDQLLTDGKVVSYSLAANRAKLWVIIEADNRREVQHILSSFPIYDYIRFTIMELAFYNQVEQNSFQFSLN
ncbi:MAG TPA: muconolactone Delta-isomerase family protein [Chitinophagales bacterium]|nr:muconolactone Delta-isomerase family protein [Chitinophagales bacterium]HRK27932.1 muconolactone Delta-isomerase family protein [Chitinophagales bacterium]